MIEYPVTPPRPRAASMRADELRSVRPSMSFPLVAGACWLAYLGGLFVTVPLATYRPMTVVALLTLTPVALTLWLAHLWNRPFDIIEPINIISGIVLVGFLGNLLFGPDTTSKVPGNDNKAIVVAVTALVTFLIGYHTGIAGRLARSVPVLGLLARPVSRGAFWWLILGWGLTIAHRSVYFLGIGYGTPFRTVETGKAIGNLILIFGQLGSYVLLMAVILASTAKHKSPAWWPVLLVAIVLEMGITAVAGWKSAPITMIIALLLMVRTAVQGTLKRAGAASLVLLICFPLFLWIFAAVHNYRSWAAVYDTSTEQLVDSVRSLSFDYDALALERFSNRIGYGSMLSTVVSAVDDGIIEYQHGATLWPAFVWFVPRWIWPDKPTMSIGGWYAVTVLGWIPGGGEAAVTLPGDLYLNFGIFGVLLGMFAYGILLRFAYDYCVRRIGSPVGLWVFLPVLLVLSLGFERNFAAIFSQASQMMVIVITVIWLCQMLSYLTIRRH
jgi:hypothetical protein